MARIRTAVLSRYVREPLVMAVAYLLYYLVRSHAAEQTVAAFSNAGQVIRLERDLGIFRELSLQAATLPYIGLTHLFNIIYFYEYFHIYVHI